MKIKVSEATNIQLDWLVAKALGFVPAVWEKRPWGRELVPAENPTAFTQNMLSPMGNSRSRRLINPTTDPAQGQPILEREGIGFFCNRTAEIGARFNPDAGADWRAFALNKHGVHFYGPTMLIAGLRCFVASKLGDEVEVPDELI